MKMHRHHPRVNLKSSQRRVVTTLKPQLPLSLRPSKLHLMVVLRMPSLSLRKPNLRHPHSHRLLWQRSPSRSSNRTLLNRKPPQQRRLMSLKSLIFPRWTFVSAASSKCARILIVTSFITKRLILETVKSDALQVACKNLSLYRTCKMLCVLSCATSRQESWQTICLTGWSFVLKPQTV